MKTIDQYDLGKNDTKDDGENHETKNIGAGSHSLSVCGWKEAIEETVSFRLSSFIQKVPKRQDVIDFLFLFHEPLFLISGEIRKTRTCSRTELASDIISPIENPLPSPISLT